MAATRHAPDSVARAATLFFQLRGLVRSQLAGGRKLDPYAWLRIETLVFIRDHDACSMTEVADHFAITAPSATSLVAALERAGLIARAKDARDKRIFRISLTSAGKRHLARAVKEGMQAVAGVFAPLSKVELTSFVAALERMVSSAHGSRTRRAH